MTIDTIEKQNAQKKYCEENKLPHFAPTDGRCFRCGSNIYQNYERPNGSISKGRSLHEATNSLITGCPHCHYSFCE